MSKNLSTDSPDRAVTRKGKIARLPFQVREEVCLRLLDGQTAPEILPWLNALPVVQERMAAHFHGKPVTPDNLSQWRMGGYAEWLLKIKHRSSGSN